MICSTALLFLLALQASAAEFQQIFTSRTGFASGTAIWNQELGVIHPTLRVMNFKTGFSPLAVDVGDGSDGPFDITTYAQFSQNGDVSGKVIHLDTSAHPILRVTHFNLALGWTLEPIGNAPLIIESLSDVVIEGVILCQGQDGVGSIGGAGRCGGLSGGDGGTPGSGGSNGADASGAVTGGRGGDYTPGSYVGGGGGGSWSTSPAADGPNPATSTGGQKGTSSPDPEFLTVAGGAGGGGGSGAAASSGGGGGGGGGVVLIRAVRDLNLGTSPSSSTGFIYVNGGTGGTASDTGGPGGGGGGGSVQAFVGGNINIYNTGHASEALAGIGGSNSSAAVGAHGGLGRSWLSSVGFNAIGDYIPAEEPPINAGNVEFNSASQFVIGQSVDLANTHPILTALTFSPISSDFSYAIAGSNDNFASDDSGWQTDLNAVAGKRFLKFKFIIGTTNVNTPTMLSRATLSYVPNTEEDFAFKAAGCGRVNGPASPLNGLLLLLAPLFILFLKFKAQRKLTL